MVETFGSSSVTVDEFEPPIVPGAKKIPPPTTTTIRAPTRTPTTPIPPPPSDINSNDCPYDLISTARCTDCSLGRQP